MVEQWVNLPKEDKYAEDGITKERCGKITLDVIFEKDNKPIQFKVKVSSVGSDNATYTRKERANINFKLREVAAGLSDKKNVLLEESIYLPAAGGNKYKIEAKDVHGNAVKAPMEVETRRKLYYQVIKMKGMKANVKTLISHLKKEFWNTGKKHYIKLKQIGSKGDINSFPNFDEHQQGNIPGLAKKMYSNKKDPFCFVLILVDQMAASERPFPPLEKAGVTITKSPITVTTPKPIWYDLDPSGSPETKWNFGGRFIPDNPLIHSVTIDSKDITYVSKYKVSVVTGSLPKGEKGTITLDLKLVNRFRTGLSLGKNAICVATRADWKQRDNDEMKSTLVHEAGHKIGMVPAGEPRELAKQSTYYENRGGHCNHNVDKCVMYGMIHDHRDNRFCSVCNKSVRRLDLDASKLAGFKTL